MPIFLQWGPYFFTLVGRTQRERFISVVKTFFKNVFMPKMAKKCEILGVLVSNAQILNDEVNIFFL